jgi:ABC-2 type transport system permease protein
VSALRATLRHELRRVCRDRALPWLVLLFAAICGYAAWNGSDWASNRSRIVHAIHEEDLSAREEYLARALRAMNGDPAHRAGVGIAFGVPYRAALPVTALSALSFGQAEGYPFEARLSAASRLPTILGTLGGSIDNPSVIAFGRFDLAFVIVLLLPLFLLAATYDLWAQERDAGSADFLLTQAARPGALLAGKALARGGSILTALTLVLLITLAAAAGHWTGATLTGLLQIGLFVLLYGGFWVGVALASNLFVRRSAAAAMVCGTAWLIFAVLMPAMLSASLDVLRPRPAAAAHVNTLRLLEQELKATPAQAGQLSRMLALIERVEADNHRYAQVIDSFEARQSARRALAQALRFLSPAVLTQDALERIAGTDADRAIEFRRQVRAFLGTLQQFAAERALAPPPSTLNDHRDGLPQFAFSEPAGISRGLPLLADFGALLAFAAAAALIVRSRLRDTASLTQESETRS